MASRDDPVVIHGAERQAMARPAVVALHHIAQPGTIRIAPEVCAAIWPGAEVVGGGDGFLTGQGEWLDFGMRGFDTGHLALRNPGPVQTLEAGQVRIIRQPATGSLAAAIHACGCYSHNYFHFLIEVLPRARAAARLAPPATPLLTEDDLPQQCYQALRLALPHHPIHTVARGQGICVDRLFAADMGSIVNDPAPGDDQPCDEALRYHPAQVRELAAMRAVGHTAQGPRRLFLWRRSRLRSLRNASRIRALLEAQGFVTIDTLNLAFADQIRLFAEAEIIVAQSGAQVSNMAFAPPGCRVLVLTSDAPGVDYRLWSALGEGLGHQVVNVAGPHDAATRKNGIHAAFHIPESLLRPLVEVDTPPPPPTSLADVLSSLHGLSYDADVLTGAWAVVSGATPPGFRRRLARLRRAAVDLALEADEATISAVFDHGFLADYGRNLRSGFSAFADLDAAEQEQAARVLARLTEIAGQGAPGEAGADTAGGEATDADATDADATDAGAENGAPEREANETGAPESEATEIDESELRRLLLLGMLLLANWQVPLPADPLALPEDLRGRWLHWAVLPPFLGRAGEDAAWVAHVARLLNWMADCLDATEGAVRGPEAALRRQVLGRVAGLDLGQLLLVDVDLNAVQAARNRVLEHVALKSGHPRARMRPAVPVAARARPVSAAPAAPERRRIGILCRTFEKGPDSEAVVAFVQGFDPARYEIFAYSVGFRDRVVSRDPDFDARFDAAIHHRRELPADPAGIRARILADDLDVFLYANATTYGIQPMDIALYHRVAPLQVLLNSHLPMAMGYPSFDAILTGKSDDPAHEVDPAQHSERLLRVPGPVIGYLTSLQPRARPALDRAALGLAATDVVMMNAGSSMKLRYQSLKAMMQAVVDVPRGVLLLAPYNPGWAARSLAFAFNTQVAATAAEVGLDPSRIRILGELSVAEAEAALSCADLYLNPFPHGGATMTHLALIYGVPPVTLRRRSTRSIDQFLIASLGFEDLLASTPGDYIALARRLGRDSKTRQALADRLRTAAKAPPFVDNPKHAARMQQAIETLMTEKLRD